MGFLGVYKAIYDYVPQAEGELAINDGDILYILEMNSEDDWWKAKKKASADDEDEPEGLIPNNYVEKVVAYSQGLSIVSILFLTRAQANPMAKARALYEYTRQTDEELSFPEDAVIDVYDTSDPDWILVGMDGDYGFVPANYIEMDDAAETAALPSSPPALPSRSVAVTTDVNKSLEGQESTPSTVTPRPNNAATALAGVMQRHPAPAIQARTLLSPQSPTSDPSDEEPVTSPTLPARPVPLAAPARVRSERSLDTRLYDNSPEVEEPPYRAPGGFHMYNINEMVSVMGKRKKMPTTLGVNLATGTILIAPERAQDGPSHEWTADKMTHYSREGKHVFLELVKPSKSVDFHAGAKDTAEEIVSALGELAGAVRAEGLREVIMAGTGRSQKKGQVLYDFMAQGEDEVTVAVGDDVIIIDDTKSEEWWQVRRVKNGKEGVVPSSYIEITGTITPPPGSSTGLNAAKSTVEQNRLEEIRLTKEAVKVAQRDSSQQVGPGMPLPERGSSLMARENGNNYGQRSKRENGRGEGSSQSRSGKSKPDPGKVRTWTDRSKSFSVEAQFLGLKDGKINLHKMNGVKIAVPVAKMSVEDLEYVEGITGISLDEDKPLSNVKKNRAASQAARNPAPVGGIGASVGQPQKAEYDWFQFFLNCDVAVGLCERYAQAFSKDSMDESVLPDVDASVLRNLGLREGDIIKVMRKLDQTYGRTKNQGDKTGTDAEGSSGGLFSGPGGALRNNTRKGRPAPAVQTSDVIDPKAFARKEDASAEDPVRSASTIEANQGAKSTGGFDDDAWDVKPSKQPPEPSRTAAAPSPTPALATAGQPSVEATESTAPTKQMPALTGSMQELSLLTTPLEPTRTAQPSGPSSAVSQPPAQIPQPTGASPSFFATVRSNPTVSPSPQQSLPRHRPAPPTTTSSPGALMPPPPARPLSAPQSAQPSAFAPPPLVPQMTGVSSQAFPTQVAPSGQSMNEISQARLQHQLAMQQQQQLQQINTYPIPQQQPLSGMMGFSQGMQQTGGPFIQSMQPMMTGAPTQSHFADPQRQNHFPPMQAQPTGFPGQFGTPQGFVPQQTGSINSFLPPALEPQRTGMSGFQPQQTGFSGLHNMGGVGFQPPGQPLQPQKTGPPPPVRFGVTGDTKKLMPQPTGRRANLSQATPNNPFGF
ncbi:SH3 domain-containing protein [Colletotrichum sojae]|uniref:Actin cytoskeleton-regulatory complex protein SLA1 n=1 Tax=Colletotrichum sojae TaxID=2175907 RepID=A0A8H6IN95_9PEZI|nr:SH3 domain-containing protein [Colletotrichum sojae]